MHFVIPKDIGTMKCTCVHHTEMLIGVYAWFPVFLRRKL